MSPSLALYFNWGPLTADTGVIAPLVFLIALAVSIPSAISYAMVSKELPSAGQAYTWLGLTVGIILFFYYMTSAGWDVPMYFALFFHDLMIYLGAPNSPAWGGIGVALLMGTTAIIVTREIRINARVVVGFLSFETLVVAVLAITILIVQGHHGRLNLEPFHFSAATAGANGIFNALIFGILSFIGYDYACVVAEEAKTPRRLMPTAVILATCLVGLFWVLASYALSEAAPLSQLGHMVASGDTPVTPISKIYWGRGDILTIITGLTAATGIYVAAVPVLARVLFAMARDGVMPRKLATLNADTGTPNVAAITVIGLGAAGTLGMAALQHGYYGSFVWFGEAAVFFALVVYIFVNIGNFAFYRRFRRDRFNVITNLCVPAVGIGIDGYLIWRAFFKALWPTGFALGSSVVIFALVVCVAAICYVVILHRRAGHLFRSDSYVLPEVDESATDESAAGASTAR
jgi:amino acid transporter